MDEEGLVHSEYTTVQVGRMLLNEAKRDFTNVNELADWDWEDEDEDEE